MRQLSIKVDNDASANGKLPASEWNDFLKEIENVVILQGGTLDPSSHTQLYDAVQRIASSLVSSGTAGNSNKLDGKTLNQVRDYIVSAITAGASTAYDTLIELQNAIQSNDGDISGILTTLSHKANEYGDNNKTFHAKTLTATNIKGRRILGLDSVDMMHKAGYISNDGNRWLRIAWVSNLTDNQFVRIDFATSNHFGNSQPPIVGSFVVRTGNDDTADNYVTPSIEQSGEAIIDFHVYRPDNTGGAGLFVRLADYSSFYITAVSKSASNLTVELYDNYPPQVGVVGAGHYPDKVITLTRPRAGQVQEISWLASYFGGSSSHDWAYIADVEFTGDNQRVVLDFVMSRGYANGHEPAVGSIALLSGNDDSSVEYVTPSVLQTKDAIENIHLYSIGGSNSNKRIFIQSKYRYSSIEVTRVATNRPTVKLMVSAPQDSVGGEARYPSNIHTIG